MSAFARTQCRGGACPARAASKYSLKKFLGDSLRPTGGAGPAPTLLVLFLGKPNIPYLPHRLIPSTMNRRHTELLQRNYMLFCTIPFVLRKSILRKLLIKYHHFTIACHFGNNRCCADGRLGLIAFYNCSCFTR